MRSSPLYPPSLFLLPDVLSSFSVCDGVTGQSIVRAAVSYSEEFVKDGKVTSNSADLGKPFSVLLRLPSLSHILLGEALI